MKDHAFFEAALVRSCHRDIFLASISQIDCKRMSEGKREGEREVGSDTISLLALSMEPLMR